MYTKRLMITVFMPTCISPHYNGPQMFLGHKITYTCLLESAQLHQSRLRADTLEMSWLKSPSMIGQCEDPCGSPAQNFPSVCRAQLAGLADADHWPRILAHGLLLHQMFRGSGPAVSQGLGLEERASVFSLQGRKGNWYRREEECKWQPLIIQRRRNVQERRT